MAYFGLEQVANIGLEWVAMVGWNMHTYVIANIGMADEFCGGGLISKIIKTVAIYAPVEVTDLEFECVNNDDLFNHLLKRGFLKTKYANTLGIEIKNDI